MKKVLIISYYWPPAGGISVLRTLKFVKFLRNFGWEPIVYVPSNATYPYLDQNNFKDIPADIEIISRPISEPFKLFKIITKRGKNGSINPVYATDKRHFLDKISIWIRGNFFIPDARCLWIEPSVRFLSDYLKENKIDAILTDGPPHTNTVIGTRLAQKFKTPFLSDFQDPWSQVDYLSLFPLTTWAKNKHLKLEQEVFKTASKITIASPTWADDLQKIGAPKPEVIYYGYDEDDFDGILREPNPNYISIVHTGILGVDRNPEVFFKAISDIIKEDPSLKKKIILNFAGIIDIQVLNSISQFNLNENLNNLGTIPRQQALKLMIDSDLLLLPINKAKNAAGRLPGKLYEYLRASQPILALGPNGSDVQKIISETNSGISINYDDYISIKLFLEKIIYKNYKIMTDNEKIKSFEVREQTKAIASILDQITK